jgi:hypothetical protein
VFIIVLSAAVLLAIAALVWLGVRGALAANHLLAARSDAQQVVELVDDPAAAADAIAKVANETSAARELTSDPVWATAEFVPWLGPQLAAVSTMAEAADDVAGDALTPLTSVASTLTPAAMKPTDGRIELSTFVGVQDAAAQAAEGIGAAADSVDRINEVALLAPLRDVVDEVRGILNQARTGTDALARASVLLPAMLGADGPRDYLVLFQNNAEWRSLGGITGAQALVHTDGGAMQLVQQDYAQNFPRFDPPALELDPEVSAIYGQSPATWMHNVTQVPDFTVSGPLARAMWAQKHGAEVDGVIALDPVALSYLLEATGPLTLSTGDTLTSENAVPLLLNEVYFRYPDPKAQNAFFDEASRAVFEALSRGQADPAKLIAALGRAGDEHRLFLWSAHEDDQSVLADTTLAGALPHSDDLVSTFGAFVNDGTGSKMDYYQNLDTQVGWEQCSVDSSGRVIGTAVLSVTVSNNAPTSGLPDYITGGGAYGVSPGSAKTVGYLYLPEGFELADATISPESGFGGGMHDDRRVLSFDVTLAPGESLTATVKAKTTVPSGAELRVQATPTVNADVTPQVAQCL